MNYLYYSFSLTADYIVGLRLHSHGEHSIPLQCRSAYTNLFNLVHTDSMKFQKKYLPNLRHKNFLHSTTSTLLPPCSILNCSGIPFGVRNCITLIFSKLIFRLLSTICNTVLSITLLYLSSSKFNILSVLTETVISPAKRTTTYCVVISKSFIYNKSKTGPSILPWGTK